jgi:signal transduction histidine kinase
MSAPRRRTLYRRVYLHGVLLLLLVAGTLAGASVFLGWDPHWRWRAPRLALHVGNLASVIPDPALPTALAQVADELELDVAIYARDGRLLASAGARAPAPLGPADAARLETAGSVLRQRHDVASAAAGPGRYVRIAIRRRGAHLLRAASSLGLIVLALALASAPLARAIAKPIEQLGHAARRLGDGDLTARSGLQRDDEIGSLARTFDEMAERLGRLLEGQRELLANVSHELRTPLARIRVALGLAADAPPREVRRHLDGIEQDVAELERLVSDVLTVTRLDGGGRLVLRREPVDLRRLVEEAVERFRRHRPGRTLETRLEASGSVDGEPGLLARVLDNLLDNAAKYSEPATPVGVELRRRDGSLLLSVSDRGSGIASEDQARVFTPFFRADRSRARDTGGVGLGLALCKRIVESHGGRIALDSAPGRGTVVDVWLPLAGPAESS